MNTNTSAINAVSNLPSKPGDAVRLFDWDQDSGRLRSREFVGTMREASGFAISIEGVQRENGTVQRRALVWRRSDRDEQLLEVEALRQLASAISAAADEIDILR